MDIPDDEGLTLDESSERNELPGERLDRNWNELLQELRVIQTGIQILFGFLLTVPFQPRFAQLTPTEHVLFMVVLGLVAFATIINLAPIMAHRLLFRLHQKPWLVRLASRSAITSIAMLGAALVTGLGLVIDLTFANGLGVWVAIGLAVLVLILWVAVPLRMRSRDVRLGEAD